MSRVAALTALAWGLAAGAGQAAMPSELRGLLDSSRPAGCTDYSFLFWDLYRAELWTNAGTPPGETFGLTLTYRASFSRAALVDSSVEEMVRISGRAADSFAAVRAEMATAFRDVEPGDRITAWRGGDDLLRLFVNGEETGVLTRDVDLFLGIWLGAETRHPEGRQALLSGQCDG